MMHMTLSKMRQDSSQVRHISRSPCQKYSQWLHLYAEVAKLLRMVDMGW